MIFARRIAVGVPGSSYLPQVLYFGELNKESLMKLEVVAESLSSKMKFMFSGLDILRSSAI